MKEHSFLYNRQLPNQIRFLEQLSEREFWDYAQSLATQQNAPLTTNEEALECWTDRRKAQSLQQGCYLFPLRALREVVEPPHKLTLLPLCPPWMPGITAWRGHIVPVVDLASYFTAHKMNKPDTTQDAYPLLSNSILLVLADANVLLGLQIALVGSIIALEQTQLAPPEEAPSWYPRHLLTTLLGVDDGSVLLNPQVLIKQIIQQINVGTADE